MNNEDLLKQVWTKFSFEDILNAGLEYGQISSSDIIQASDIYKDPDKEYDEGEVRDMIDDVALADLLNYIQDKYSLEDIVVGLGKKDVLDSIDADDRLDSLEFTYELEQHDDDVRDNYRDELLDEFFKEVDDREEERVRNMYNWCADDLHTLICDVVGTSYYDQSTPNRLKEKLNSNSYNVNYD